MELGPHDSVEGLLRLHKSRSDRTDPKPHLVRLSGLGHPGPVQSGSDDRILRSKSHRVGGGGGGGGHDHSKIRSWLDWWSVQKEACSTRGIPTLFDDCGQRGQGIGLLDLEPKQSVRLGHSPAKAPDRPPLSGPFLDP